MKSILTEARQHFSDCVLTGGEDASESATTSQNNNFLVLETTERTPTSAYDTLEKPFKYDKLRGRWSIPLDFYSGCTVHTFGSLLFSEVPVYGVMYGGVFFFPGYILAMLLYAIPVFQIQSFLGQFSTSGAISAFRVVPIFKGIGYSIVFLNLASLSYYAILAALPLIYAVSSLSAPIPWMTCNNAWNTANCSVHTEYNISEPILEPHSTVEFFRTVVPSANGQTSNLYISCPLLSAVLVIWLFVLVVLLMGTDFIGKYFRVSCFFIFPIAVATFVNIMWEHKVSWIMLASYMKAAIDDSITAVFSGFRAGIFISTWVLGPGWGSVLTLASHNHFKTDIQKWSKWVAITYFLATIMALICGRIALDHFEDHVGLFHYDIDEDNQLQFVYLCHAHLVGSSTKFPSIWSLFFFGMLLLTEFNAMIIQMTSVLRAVFDEHESLRSKKKSITIAVAVFLMFCSVYFCTKQGFAHLDTLPNCTAITHIIISFLLLIISLWIYGRKRFQCDLQFMIGKVISYQKIFLLKFITPGFLVICLTQLVCFLELYTSPFEFIVGTQIVVYFAIPAYMVFKIWKTTGSLSDRLKQCFTPLDWHPVNADTHQCYEEMMGTAEMLVSTGSDLNERISDYA